MIESDSPVDNFLSFLKQETGKDVYIKDAVFHRDYAKYRHLLYPDTEEDCWKSDSMVRTWINVILREGITDELRTKLFPNRFDLGNTKYGKDTHATLSDLIDEIGTGAGNAYGKKNYKEIKTVVDGIKNTIGYDLSNKNIYYPVTSLKVISLLKKIVNKRNPHVHLMYSDRLPDGIGREPEKMFSRFNSKQPENGGCKKDSGGLTRQELRENVIVMRKTIAELQNQALAEHGHEARVDHRSLREQGKQRQPERHMGAARIRHLSAEDKAALTAQRFSGASRAESQ